MKLEFKYGFFFFFLRASLASYSLAQWVRCHRARVFRLCSDYHIQWAPDNKWDPPEEIYSHYFIWHRRRAAYIIHALGNICIDPCQGHLDGHSSWQNWPIAASKLDICKNAQEGWIMRVCAAPRCTRSATRARRKPNDTCLRRVRPETENPNTVVTRGPADIWMPLCSSSLFSLSSSNLNFNPPRVKKHTYRECRKHARVLFMCADGLFYCWYLLLMLLITPFFGEDVKTCC